MDNTGRCYLLYEVMIPEDMIHYSFFPSRNIHPFPGGSDGKESACSAGDLGSIPGLGRSPGGGHGYLLQYSCLENSMDRKESGMTE